MSDLIDRQALLKTLNENDVEFNADVNYFIMHAPSANQWIPCLERLPEDGTWNIFTDGKRISIERYKFDIVSHFWPEPRWFDLEDAVAWMPLPEPWKGEDNA